MRAIILYLYPIFCIFIPETKFFGLKRFILSLAKISIGKNVRICSSVRFIGNGQISIGDNTWIGPQSLISSSAPSAVVIGANIDIAPRVFIGNGSHEVDPNGLHSAGKGITGDITIEDGAWIGTGCIVLLNVKIGRKSIIAAGSVVNKDIEENIIAGGIPCKTIKPLN